VGDLGQDLAPPVWMSSAVEASAMRPAIIEE
jgi:hypothetical protein